MVGVRHPVELHGERRGRRGDAARRARRRCPAETSSRCCRRVAARRRDDGDERQRGDGGERPAIPTHLLRPFSLRLAGLSTRPSLPSSDAPRPYIPAPFGAQGTKIRSRSETSREQRHRDQREDHDRGEDAGGLQVRRGLQDHVAEAARSRPTTRRRSRRSPRTWPRSACPRRSTGARRGTRPAGRSPSGSRRASASCGGSRRRPGGARRGRSPRWGRSRSARRSRASAAIP